MKKRALKTIRTGFNKKEIKILFPLFYIFILLLGLNLALFGGSEFFTTCSGFLGDEFCTPTGIFIALVASLPGYVVAGNIFSENANLHWAFSLMIIVVVSGIFYYLLGAIIDKFKKEGLTTQSITKTIIIVGFIVLLLLLLALV